jgi:hypothetical protein
VKGDWLDLWYSGKAGEHYGNIQALSAQPDARWAPVPNAARQPI